MAQTACCSGPSWRGVKRTSQYMKHFCVQLFCVFTPAPVTPQSVQSCRICFLIRAAALDTVLCLLQCGGEDGGWMLESVDSTL